MEEEIVEATAIVVVPERRYGIEVGCKDCDQLLCGWSAPEGTVVARLEDVLTFWTEDDRRSHEEHATHTLDFYVSWLRVCTVCDHAECPCCKDWCDVTTNKAGCAACLIEKNGVDATGIKHTHDDDFCCEGRCSYVEPFVRGNIFVFTHKDETPVEPVG